MKHRSHLKQKNKAHKSGHAAKQQHKQIKQAVPKPAAVVEKGQKERRLQSASARKNAKIADASANKFLGTKKGPPKVIGFLPCSENADLDFVFSTFQFTPETEDFMYPSGILSSGQFAHRVLPLRIDREIDVLIDTCKIADILVLVFADGEKWDPFGEMAISVCKSLGLPTTIGLVIPQEGASVSKATVNNYRDFLTGEIPEITRILPYNSEQDMEQLVRFLSVTSPKNISWRNNRPYMAIQNYAVVDGAVEISGFVRGAPLDVHQIVNIPYIGDMHMLEVNGEPTIEELRHPLIYTMENEDIATADIHPPQNIDVTSPEQLAEDIAQLGIDEQDTFGAGFDEPEEPEAFDLDQDELEAMAKEDVWLRDKEELEFPDEFDYNANTVLRERLQKYRGLKSFRNSPWNPKANLPPHYSTIFEFPAINRVSDAAVAEQLNGQVLPGSFVTIKLAADDLSVWDNVPEGRILSMFGLFRNETRLTVLNCTIHNSGGIPLISKESILIVCGFRHLWVSPLFNEDDRCDKHMFLRVLSPNEHAIASFVAPAMMQTCPISYFKELDGQMVFVGTGSLKSVDPNRLIIKRYILTGRPYRTIGSTARVALMFFNRPDIEWFQSVGLWSKHKQGHITATVGEKGHFKCRFNEQIFGNDTICMSLYKRIFPKNDTAPVSY